MLGLTGGKVLAGGSFGQANVPHKLDWVDCTGAEVSLTQCKYNVRPSCGDHRHDVGVECTTPPDLPVRLVGSTDPLQGRLEVGKECERGQGQSAVAGCTASTALLTPCPLAVCRSKSAASGGTVCRAGKPNAQFDDKVRWACNTRCRAACCQQCSALVLPHTTSLHFATPTRCRLPRWCAGSLGSRRVARRHAGVGRATHLGPVLLRFVSSAAEDASDQLPTHSSGRAAGRCPDPCTNPPPLGLSTSPTSSALRQRRSCRPAATRLPCWQHAVVHTCVRHWCRLHPTRGHHHRPVSAAPQLPVRGRTACGRPGQLLRARAPPCMQPLADASSSAR